MYQPIRLEGRSVILEEIQPKYFSNVIDWRNNKELNQFLNQPYELTMELEQKWFENYIEDGTQGFMIMIDKKSGVAFGTVGWTDFDRKTKTCIEGRLLIGDERFNGSIEFLEALILINDYLYQDIGIEKMYIHVVRENKKALRLNRKFGYVENLGEIQFPKELFVNGLNQIEFSRLKEEYAQVRKNFMYELNLLI